MAITPTNSTLTVTTAGTATQCTADTDIKPSSVYFEALGTNTGDIYIGLSGVSSTAHIVKLDAGEGFELKSDGLGGHGRIGDIGLQLSDLYVDASVSGEKVQMTYMYPIGQ